MSNLWKMGVLTLVLAVATFSTATAQKFGYVNSAEILAELPAVKSAEAELEALQKQLRKQGQAMVEKFQADYVALQEKVERGELSPKQQEEEAAKLEKRQAEIRNKEGEMTNQMEAKRNDLLQPIYDMINTAIADVAKEGGYTFIFDQQILLYSEPAQDVSTQVKAKIAK
ncbi:MAG: OmpH family outer membrane protein [Saprospiraceae bacterium]